MSYFLYYELVNRWAQQCILFIIYLLFKKEVLIQKLLTLEGINVIRRSKLWEKIKMPRFQRIKPLDKAKNFVVVVENMNVYEWFNQFL